MKKLLTLATLITLKISTVLAYHGTHNASGGSTLPIYETVGDNALYLFLPFLAYSFVFHGLMQTYLDRKYKDTTLKNAEDYRNLTVGISGVLTFFLMFTRLFQSLPSLEIASYAVLMGVVLFTGLLINRRAQLEKIYDSMTKN